MGELDLIKRYQELLDKVWKEGIESLTSEEKEFMDKMANDTLNNGGLII
ncbi:MAG: hypothetical protein IKR19_08815 [Acholeplasmatales bacterium]|nr:hypothetical protein [Acholeplasmatales bacterium]